MSVNPISLEINQHDDKRFYFTLEDSDGVPVLVDDMSDIIFSLAPNLTSPSTWQKSLAAGTLIKSGDSEVYIDVSDTESGALSPGGMYCEVRGITVGGLHQTLGGGSFSITDTQIGDYP